VAPVSAVIAFLRGRLLEKHPNRLIVDVSGVGYDVYVPLSTFYVAGDPGADVSLRVHTHVREDALSLFGFATAMELQIFERLISISGIGPKLALVVLSGIESDDLVRAIESADVARLTAIPGIGKKTAERIVLELKDKLPRAVAEPAGVSATSSRAAAPVRSDLVSALLNLGYHRPLAEKAVDAALTSKPDATFENALRQALRELSR
jgi:holliday junction DNA helicase RuvA